MSDNEVSISDLNKKETEKQNKEQIRGNSKNERMEINSE